MIDFFALLKPSIPVERPGKASFRDDKIHNYTLGWFEEKETEKWEKDWKGLHEIEWIDVVILLDFGSCVWRTHLSFPKWTKISCHFLNILAKSHVCAPTLRVGAPLPRSKSWFRPCIPFDRHAEKCRLISAFSNIFTSKKDKRNLRQLP